MSRWYRSSLACASVRPMNPCVGKWFIAVALVIACRLFRLRPSGRCLQSPDESGRYTAFGQSPSAERNDT